MTNCIESLKKVSLSIKVIDGNGNTLVAEPRLFTFIYGAASDGLCPLEIALDGLLAGDNTQVSIASNDMGEVCGHLLQPLHNALDLPIMPTQFSLDITVAEVSVAENHEIVKALAKSMGGGSCHGDCSCGCC